MRVEDLNSLLTELCSQPQEQQWLEFKLNKGSISHEEIGEYISAMEKLRNNMTINVVSLRHWLSL